MTMPPALRQTIVITRKELTDAFRDRRALVSIVFSILFGPIIVGFMLNRLADRQRDAEDVRIPVVGEEHAPALVDWLRQQSGVHVVSGPADPEAAVRDQREDVVLVIPKEFAERFRVSRPAPVRVVADSARNAARPKADRVRGLLQRYGAEVGSLRLIGRGVSPVIVTPLKVEEIEVSSAQQRAASILAFIPMFIVMAAFVGGMQIAIDSTAGERERGSLEPLLVNPVPRGALAAGKWLAATSTSMLAVVASATLCVILIRFIPLQDMGIRFRVGPVQLAGMLAVLLPFCPFATAVQACMGTSARSFKEAQSYMTIVMIVPILPGLLATLYPVVTTRPWAYPIPILGQYGLMTGVLGGRMPGAVPLMVAAAACLLVAVILLRLITRLFHSERIIFGR
jgi:sodium transport system permease protein